MKFMVRVVRCGDIYIEADPSDKAYEIAEKQETNDIDWSAEWDITDVEENDDIDDECCIPG